ncbi:MAG: pyruvate kinase [Candidatus Aenigmarchaeota archaeon]|nr:pyruvate kinase [Candidatus Aenigmarchaeota archaeon]
MKKTKVVCTLGPASDDETTIKALADAGMNVARLNFSHGDYKEHKARIDKIKKINKTLEFPIAILLDMQGPEIRTGIIKNDIRLKTGDILTLTTEKNNDEKILVNYSRLPLDVKQGNEIFIDDGLISLQVLRKTKTDVICKVLNNAILGSKKTVNLPGAELKMPSYTEKDWQDVKFGLEQDVDYLAVSFVRTKKDILALRKFLGVKNGEVGIIAKIEHPKAIENFDEILKVSDGIMIARGDLGVEIPLEKVPIHQYDIIKKCNHAKKPVITATHMLNSMIENPRPTRAEVTDVANAILIGTDAVMLSGETAKGKYPVHSCKMMSKIALEIETKIKTRLKDKINKENIPQIVSHSVALAATTLNARAIASFTETGNTACMLSKYRTPMPIYALTPKEEVLRKLALMWGVFPLYLEEHNDLRKMVKNGVSLLKKLKHVKTGDYILLTAGTDIGTPGTTNFAEIVKIE